MEPTVRNLWSLDRTMGRWLISWVSTHCPPPSWTTLCTAASKQRIPSTTCTPPRPCSTWCPMPSSWLNRCVPLRAPCVCFCGSFTPQETHNFLSFSSQKGFDVFNALDLMENKTFLEKLKFGIGDGNLQYYLYNWKCPSMGSEKVTFLFIKA